MSNRNNRCYCIQLRRTTGILSALYDKHLAPVNLTINQYSLLINLQRLEVCSVSELAEKVRLERTTCVRMVKPLMKRGLVCDNSSKGERSRKLALTDEGKDLLKRAIPLWEKAQEELDRKLGKEKVDTFLSILCEIEQM